MELFEFESVVIQVVALAKLLPANGFVDELDSYMYQTVSHSFIFIH